MPAFWICFWFWIYQDSGYTKVSNVHESINTNSNINSFMKYAKLDRVLIMVEYAWIILGYAWLCLNVRKYVWMAFVIHLFTCCNSLSINCFSESKNLIFFYSSWNIYFVYCFRLNIFTIKISNLLLHLRAERVGGCKSYATNYIPSKHIYDYFLMIYLSILLLLFFPLFATSKELIRDSRRL